MRITRIHQIEMTSRCNLKCKYCIHPTMPRAKLDMSDEHFYRALELVKYFCDKGTQGGELDLCGVGESTLHPKFAEFILAARQAVGKHRMLSLPCNGIDVSEDLIKVMAEAGLSVWVGMHRPERAGPVVNLMRKHGVLAGISTDPAMAAVDWAGQVKWEVTAARSPCPWIREGRSFVMADGNITTCAFDGSGAGIVGHIMDDIESIVKIDMKPYSLCKSCHQIP